MGAVYSMDWSYGAEYWSEVEWSGVESDFGVANVGHSLAPRHKEYSTIGRIDC